jgi:transcriptional regulator with PAS, ATPase and Fis domain
MKKVFEIIKRVAVSDGTVLITGKSGTGKELVARAIHYNSKRKHKRFVPINCGAIVETLFESELFGHKKGSFTGATFDKDGLLKVAEGGTVFLDEVSEIPLHLQVKLLRAIEQKEITPVGTTELVPIDVRIIAASNRDLRAEAEKGNFRDDLYYRLDVITINLPSLSERPDDVPILANHFLNIYRTQMSRPLKGFTNQAMKALIEHTWKGEVRELENIVERSVIFCDSEFIGLEHLPEYLRPASMRIQVAEGNVEKLSDAVKEFEKKFIYEALKRCKGNSKEAAVVLGISRSSLYRKMEEYKISNE